MLAPWHFHIEISSKCTLKCPRCPRQESPETLVNSELDLDFFKRNFTPEFILKHVEKITWCGDDGDPIYAHDFLEVIKYIKSIKKVAMSIITNGSYKKESFWAELGQVLDSTDQVHFSIDGYDQQSNEQYRVNSNWDSIMLGVKTIRANSQCLMIWDMIGFKFNEEYIGYMKQLAVDLGFDIFQLNKSTKFGAYNPIYGVNDPLQPSANLIASGHRFERELYNLSGRELVKPWLPINLEFYRKVDIIDDKIKPLCHVGNKGLFIDSQGNFYPCCWVANRYSHNSNWMDISRKFNLHKNLLEDVIIDEFWNKEFINNSLECVNKCHKDIVTEKYAT
jgi:MoaA/NifB/PqqE/SkfB family radical SAM enzyme